MKIRLALGLVIGHGGVSGLGDGEVGGDDIGDGGGGDGGGSPSIAVDQQKIDYGDVKFNVEKTFAIKVTNTGDGTLRFKEEPYIEVLEGC